MAGKNKKEKEEGKNKNLYLGRFLKSLKMGLVGLPNVGKSSLFNLLSELDIPAENYPFCTVDHHKARVRVPDQRYTDLVEAFSPKDLQDPYLTVWDIAGLIRGAHEGAGLGNQFLSNIQAVDGLFHVVRAFEDDQVIHVDGEVNPINDLETVSHELKMKDTQLITARLEKLNKILERIQDKPSVLEKECLEKVILFVI